MYWRKMSSDFQKSEDIFPVYNIRFLRLRASFSGVSGAQWNVHCLQADVWFVNMRVTLSVVQFFAVVAFNSYFCI